MSLNSVRVNRAALAIGEAVAVALLRAPSCELLNDKDGGCFAFERNGAGSFSTASISQRRRHFPAKRPLTVATAVACVAQVTVESARILYE